MRRLHRRLPEGTLPLTPREIVDSASRQVGAPLGDANARDVTLGAHFLYGAAVGAMFSVMNPDPSKKAGALAGSAGWLASYMGWIPPSARSSPRPGTPRGAMR